jgi:hypothetical protein
MARPRILDLIDRQSEDLAKLEDRQVSAFLKAYEDARRELREQLDTMVKTGLDKKTPFTAQHLRVMLAQTETGITALQRRLGKVLVDASTQTRQRSLQDLLKTIATAEPEFTDTGGRIEQRALQRLTTPDGLLLHEHNVQRYGRDLVSKIQAELVTAVTRGSTLDQVVERIVGADKSVFAGMRARAELIARMELNRAYNEGHQSSLEEAAAVLDADGTHEGDPLVKRADEFRDRRNHPFSRALDGKTTSPTMQVKGRTVPGEWSVPDSEVQAQAMAMGRPAKGIVWRKEGSTWKGSMHPAHYNDRGRMTPWRESWAEDLEDLPKAPVRKTYTYKAPAPNEEPAVVQQRRPRTGGRTIPTPKT